MPADHSIQSSICKTVISNHVDPSKHETRSRFSERLLYMMSSLPGITTGGGEEKADCISFHHHFLPFGMNFLRVQFRN